MNPVRNNILTPLQILFSGGRWLFVTGLTGKRRISNGMKRIVFFLILMPFILVNISRCVALMVGSAAGALGANIVSRDTIQGETDKSYDSLWNAAKMVSRIRGSIKQEDRMKGYIELEIDASKVWIRLLRLTRTTTRLRISSRKYHLPNIELAQDIFVKIMEEAR